MPSASKKYSETEIVLVVNTSFTNSSKATFFLAMVFLEWEIVCLFFCLFVCFFVCLFVFLLVTYLV